jgi:hypothetical protein
MYILVKILFTMAITPVDDLNQRLAPGVNMYDGH